jgi:hypothetical protein
MEKLFYVFLNQKMPKIFWIDNYTNGDWSLFEDDLYVGSNAFQWVSCFGFTFWLLNCSWKHANNLLEGNLRF